LDLGPGDGCVRVVAAARGALSWVRLRVRLRLRLRVRRNPSTDGV
jgi:predicted nicotinamide N-methyase